MKVLFDTSVLSLYLSRNARPPLNPETNKPVEHAKERLSYLIKELRRLKATIIIPSPVLCEVLVGARGEAVDEYTRILSTHPFRTANFDNRAAIECAKFLRQRIPGSSIEKGKNRQGIKFDYQIISIGLVEKVDRIYADDGDIVGTFNSHKITVIQTHELPTDPSKRQGDLPFEEN